MKMFTTDVARSEILNPEEQMISFITDVAEIWLIQQSI